MPFVYYITIATHIFFYYITILHKVMQPQVTSNHISAYLPLPSVVSAKWICQRHLDPPVPPWCPGQSQTLGFCICMAKRNNGKMINMYLSHKGFSKENIFLVRGYEGHLDEVVNSPCHLSMWNWHSEPWWPEAGSSHREESKMTASVGENNIQHSAFRICFPWPMTIHVLGSLNGMSWASNHTNIFVLLMPSTDDVKYQWT